MPQTTKIFNNGRSQAIPLPKAFRFEENEVSISREGNSGVSTPKTVSWIDVYEKLPKITSFDRGVLPSPEEREEF